MIIVKGNVQVHDEEVKVVDAPISKLLSADWLDVLLVVEGVPELGDEEEVFALDEALFYGTSDALTGFFLVAVVYSRSSQPLPQRVLLPSHQTRTGILTTSTIEQPIPSLDGIVNGVGTSVIVHLPQPKADNWHLIAIVEFDRRSSHAGVSAEGDSRSLRSVDEIDWF